MKKWTYERVLSTVCGFFIRDQDGSIVARVMKVGVPSNGDFSLPAEENARLIAAAPDMLAVLEHIQRCIPYGGFAQIHYESATWADIDAAITKATGRTE